MAGESAYLVRGCWKVACEDRLLFSLWYPFQVAAPNVLVGILRSIFGRLFLFEAFACNIQTVKTWMREQEGDRSLGDTRTERQWCCGRGGCLVGTRTAVGPHLAG